MIVEYIRYRIPDSAATAFEDAYHRAQEWLARSSHCVDFELSRGVEESDRYILRIRWDSLEGHIDGFRSSPEFREFFSEIRTYVDVIEEMSHYEPTSVVGAGAGTSAPPTLYEWAGGEAALEKLFVRFYEIVPADDLLGPLFAGMDPHHAQHVAMWLGEVFGGPTDYTDHRGGYENMLGHHIDKSITPQQRRRWVTLLIDAADEVGLPDDAEFRAAFVSYLEWGTRLAMENSQPGATPVPHAPVPRWGWGVAPPWQG